MAETLESIKQEIAKIAAEKAELKGVVDQQKETIVRQETTIGNLREALKAADANTVDQVNKLQKEIDEFKEALDREATENAELQQKVKDMGKTIGLKQDEIDRVKKSWDKDYDGYKEDVRKLTELKEDLKAELDHYKKALNDETKEIEEESDKAIEQLQKEIKNRDEYIQELEAAERENVGTIAALAAKDEELNSATQEINDLKEQVKSKNQDLEQSYKEFNKLSMEKEHLVNAIENAYRSLMITRGYQLPDESGVSNG